MEKKEPAPGELLRDKLDMLILKTLQRGPMHGYGIAEFIEQRSEAFRAPVSCNAYRNFHQNPRSG